jgi:hypothetical protein
MHSVDYICKPAGIRIYLGLEATYVSTVLNVAMNYMSQWYLNRARGERAHNDLQYVKRCKSYSICARIARTCTMV